MPLCSRSHTRSFIHGATGKCIVGNRRGRHPRNIHNACTWPPCDRSSQIVNRGCQAAKEGVVLPVMPLLFSSTTFSAAAMFPIQIPSTTCSHRADHIDASDMKASPRPCLYSHDGLQSLTPHVLHLVSWSVGNSSSDTRDSCHRTHLSLPCIGAMVGVTSTGEHTAYRPEGPGRRYQNFQKSSVWRPARPKRPRNAGISHVPRKQNDPGGPWCPNSSLKCRPPGTELWPARVQKSKNAAFGVPIRRPRRSDMATGCPQTHPWMIRRF